MNISDLDFDFDAFIERQVKLGEQQKKQRLRRERYQRMKNIAFWTGFVLIGLTTAYFSFVHPRFAIAVVSCVSMWLVILLAWIAFSLKEDPKWTRVNVRKHGER